MHLARAIGPRPCRLFAMGMLGCIGPIRAEEQAQVLDPVPDVVVTATRTAFLTFDAPYTADVLRSRDVHERLQPRTLPEALRETPGVMVQKTAQGQGSPYLRGFTGFRTLFLVDGIRLNHSAMRDGPNQYWNTVDSQAIERLEVVKGPASALYGSDAVGGTVNAITPSALDGRGGPGGLLRYRYASAEDAHGFRAESRYADSQFGVRAGATRKSIGDLRSGAGPRQPFTGYEEWGADVRADSTPSPSLRLTLAHQTVELDDVWRTHSTIYAVPFRGTRPGSDLKRASDQRRHLTYARAQSSNPLGPMDEWTLTLSHHRQEEVQHRIRADQTRDWQGFDVDTLGLTLQGLTLDRGGDWMYGVEYYEDFVDSFSRAYAADGALRRIGIQGPVADEARYGALGLYVQNTLPIGAHADVVAGVRYTRIAADADAFEDPQTRSLRSLSQSWDALAGSARAVLRPFPDRRLRLFAGVSQGFRAPNLSDLTRLDSARSDEYEVPSPDLDPERFLAFEAGVRAEARGAHIEASVFHTDTRDLIIRTPTGRVLEGEREVVKLNAGDGFVQGVEVKAGARVSDDWQLWGNLVWAEGENDVFNGPEGEKTREPMDRMMPMTAQGGVRYEPVYAWWIELVAAAAARQDKLSSGDKADTGRIPPGGTPGYAVFTLRSGWRATRHLTLTAALENLTDRDYRIHGSGVNEPGRNLVLAAEAKF